MPASIRVIRSVSIARYSGSSRCIRTVRYETAKNRSSGFICSSVRLISEVLRPSRLVPTRMLRNDAADALCRADGAQAITLPEILDRYDRVAHRESNLASKLQRGRLGVGRIPNNRALNRKIPMSQHITETHDLTPRDGCFCCDQFSRQALTASPMISNWRITAS